MEYTFIHSQIPIIIMRNYLFVLLLLCTTVLQSQPSNPQLTQLEQALTEVEGDKKILLQKIENTKLDFYHQALVANGLPALKSEETIIHHTLLSLVYSELHEQAKWVAHVISPDILNGTVSRSNDFREDPKVKTGTAIEEDYFLQIINKKGATDYDGFGWDRGHLAPSADFRWSKKALSESYFYSNMSPQTPDFNRKSWAALENNLRAYVYREQVPLFVVTGGILTPDLPVIERSIQKVAIPQFFWKVAVDLENKRGIGFIMPNQLADYPTEHYATTIDEIEQLTGIDFYAALADDLEQSIEHQKQTKDWFKVVALGDVEPLDFSALPTKHFNTIIGKRQAGHNKAVHICGTVVRARTTRKGNVLFNLDKAYPNEIFNVFINKDNLIHFPNNPVKDYLNQQICAYGEVGKIGKTPTIYVEDGKQIKLLEMIVGNSP